MRKLILIIIFPLLLSLQSSFAEGWEIVSEIPIPVMGGQALVKDGLIYIIGGYTDSTYSALNKIQVYDPKLNTWEILSDTLIALRYGHSAVMYGNDAVVIGGYPGQDSLNFSMSMWDFDSAPYFYDHDPNFGRNFATAQLYGNDIFIFGGQIYNLVDSLQSAYIIQYNIPTATLVFKSDTLFTDALPLQQMSASLDDKIYIFGGAYNGVLNKIYCFDPVAAAWENEVGNMLEKRAGGAAVAIGDNTILIIGGYNEQDNALASTEMFNSGGYYNTGYYPLNIGRTELTAAIIDFKVYVFSGKDAGGACVSSVEMIDASPNTDIDLNYATKKPMTFLLKNNYPNPFNPKTKIGYQIPSNSSSPLHVRLSVYDILGKEVAVLVDEYQNGGEYEAEWNADGFASGIYFYRLSTPAGLQTKSMLLIR